MKQSPTGSIPSSRDPRINSARLGISLKRNRNEFHLEAEDAFFANVDTSIHRLAISHLVWLVRHANQPKMQICLSIFRRVGIGSWLDALAWSLRRSQRACAESKEAFEDFWAPFGYVWEPVRSLWSRQRDSMELVETT